MVLKNEQEKNRYLFEDRIEKSALQDNHFSSLRKPNVMLSGILGTGFSLSPSHS